MKFSKQFLVFALGFPVLSLLFLTGYRIYHQNVGQEVILDIMGYDPRDLLSGHYLTFRVDYGVSNLCKTEKGFPIPETVDGASVCLDPRSFAQEQIADCKLLIKGSCRYGQFVANIERFYVPESQANQLEILVRDKQAKIVVNVSSDGMASIKDLLIDGKPWKEISK
jgi:uncharacterized membrane-anchored protein